MTISLKYDSWCPWSISLVKSLSHTPGWLFLHHLTSPWLSSSFLSRWPCFWLSIKGTVHILPSPNLPIYLHLSLPTPLSHLSQMKCTSWASPQGQTLHSCLDSIPFQCPRALFPRYLFPAPPGSFPPIAPHAVISAITKKDPSFTTYPSLALAPFFWFLIVILFKAISYIVTFTFPPHSLLSPPLLLFFLARPETDFPVTRPKLVSVLISLDSSAVMDSCLFPSWNRCILTFQIAPHRLLLLLFSCGSSELLSGFSMLGCPKVLPLSFNLISFHRMTLTPTMCRNGPNLHFWPTPLS